MKKILFAFALICLTATYSFSQDGGNTMATSIKALVDGGGCKEIIFISVKEEKKYSEEWISTLKQEGSTLVFTKKEAIHRWSMENAGFIEKIPSGSSFILRVFIY